MKIQIFPWGETKDNETASRYLLTNQNGMEVELSDFGALILAIRLPVNGVQRDVVLGYDTLQEYYNNGAGFGAYVGRNANRIANAEVTIDGVRYALEPNDNGNNLHSGSVRSHYCFYASKTVHKDGSAYVEFSRVSPHLEQGFPGNLQQHIRYTLTEQNELLIDYSMVSDKTTVINPTNHCYFNLMGQGSILEHKLTVFAEQFLPTDKKLIPTGELASVSGTPLDFQTPTTVGARIHADFAPLRMAGGYDHNYCLKGNGRLQKAAILQAPDESVTMTVFTDRPGVQIYSGNFLNGGKGKNGAAYHKNGGICLETQAYPNACNEARFPTTVCRGGTVFESRTVYQFDMKP